MLFMSPRTAEHMTWHQSHDAVDGVMVHLFNDEEWKHFNSVHPHFSAELRNVRLKLCINRFNTFGSFPASYFCWPIILSLSLTTRNVYEAGVHVFIYCHTRSKQLGLKYRCLFSTVD
jgi:hypothetical protein